MVGHLRALVSLCLFVVVTLVIGVPLMSLSLAKLVLYRTSLRPVLTRWLDKTASAWISCNNFHQKVLLPTRLKVEGPETFARRQWFMLIVNHQSWVDILVLIRVLNRKVPYFKFFLKTSLFWIPIIGLACWALDFPFMRRHSKEQIERDPALAGRDLDTTRKQCERYSNKPVTIISYVEGTRFTPAKHAAQRSPYQHLLIPKAGGMAFTLAAMSERINTILDVTIHYPGGRPNFWQYLGGKVKRIDVVVQERPVTDDLIGDYARDPQFKAHFQSWVNGLWQEKDALLERLSEQR